MTLGRPSVAPPIPPRTQTGRGKLGDGWSQHIHTWGPLHLLYCSYPYRLRNQTFKYFYHCTGTRFSYCIYQLSVSDRVADTNRKGIRSWRWRKYTSWRRILPQQQHLDIKYISQIIKSVTFGFLKHKKGAGDCMKAANRGGEPWWMVVHMQVCPLLVKMRKCASAIWTDSFAAAVLVNCST